MKKIVAFLLAVVMIACVLVSCDDGEKQKKKREKSTDTAVVTEETVLDENSECIDYARSLAANANYQGATFTYLGGGLCSTIPTEREETGEILSDAVYYRIRDLEDFFGITFEIVETDNGIETSEMGNREVMAGGNSYDIAEGNLQNAGEYLFINNSLVDASQLSALDFSQEWWISNLENELSINERLFFLAGPVTANFFKTSSAVVFNKTVCTDFNIDVQSLYDSVREGNWTLDKMVETASAVPATTSPTSGVFRYNNPAGPDWIFASGNHIILLDETGTPYIEEKLSTELSDMSDKLYGIFHDETTNAYNIGMEDAAEKFGISATKSVFSENRALFQFTSTGGVADLRTEDCEFGVLPMPKYYPTQDKYYAYADQTGNACLYILKCTADTERTGTLVEAMAALSNKYMRDAYYDKVLKGRSVYDFESRDMIDIIFNNTVYDLIGIFSGGDLNQEGEFVKMLYNAFYLDNSKLASSYGPIAKVMNRTIKQTLKRIK